MKKFSFPVRTVTFALVLVSLFTGACSQQDTDNPAKPHVSASSAIAEPMTKKRQPEDMQIDTAIDDVVSSQKIRQWETIQDVALQDYDACLATCGGAAGCLANCEQAYVRGLAAEYKILLHE